MLFSFIFILVLNWYFLIDLLNEFHEWNFEIMQQFLQYLLFSWYVYLLSFSLDSGLNIGDYEWTDPKTEEEM